jgi:hypothetical protein
MLLNDFKDAADCVFLDELGLEGLGHFEEFQDFCEGVHGEAVEAVFSEDLMDAHLGIVFVFHGV